MLGREYGERRGRGRTQRSPSAASWIEKEEAAKKSRQRDEEKMES